MIYSKRFVSILFYFIASTLFMLPCVAETTDSLKKGGKMSFAGVVLPGVKPENGFYIQGGLVSLFKTDYKDSLLRSSNIYLFGLYSQYNQYRFSMGGDVFTKKEKYYITGWIYYSYLPELFFGTGNNVSAKKNEFLDYRVAYFNSSLLRRLYKKWFAGPVYTYEYLYNLNTAANGLVEKYGTIGMENYSVSVPGFRLRHDSRDFVISTNKGLFIDFYYSASGKAIGSNYTFNQTSLDIRKFINFTPKKYNILALNLLLKNSSGQVPFRFLPNITARGYHPNLYRNKSLISLQVEYRLRIWNWIGASFLGGISEVADSYEKMDLRKWKENYGGGLRFRVIKKHNMYLRIEYGRGGNTSNYYLSFYDEF